jgi:3'(2'), 5'-bisphosphate nucleotidase
LGPELVAYPVADRNLLDALTGIVARAAATIMAIGSRGVDIKLKGDQSPVTAADVASEAVILESLAPLLPGVPVVSEEATGRRDLDALPSVFALVDPLDGTREFIAGRDEFAVNLALIVERKAVLGVLAAPMRGVLWRGIVGGGAERLTLALGDEPKAVEPTPVRTRTAPAGGLVAAMSRSHLDAATESFLGAMPVAERMQLGSAIKFGLLAEGKADLYPRLSPTCEWDIAAGHAVLSAAGGTLTRPDGSAIAYGSLERNLLVPDFVAWGDPVAARRNPGRAS